MAVTGTRPTNSAVTTAVAEAITDIALVLAVAIEEEGASGTSGGSKSPGSSTGTSTGTSPNTAASSAASPGTAATTSTPATTNGSPTPDANPAPEAGDHWAPAQQTSSLFGPSGQPSPNDIVEGSYQGDCFLLSDMALLAEKNPNFIKDHIQEIHPNGANAAPEYQVELYNKAGQEEKVTLDNSQMLDANGNIAGAGQDFTDSSHALWPALYEKAYAIVNGESMQQATGEEGYPAEAMQTLTGQAGTDYAQQTIPNPSAFASLANGPNPGMTIETHAGANYLPGWNAATQTATFDNGRYQATQSGNTMTVRDTQSDKTWTFPKNHIMAVMGVTSTDPQQSDPSRVTNPNDLMVQLENPWGPNAERSENMGQVPYTVLQALTGAYSTEPV